MIVPSSDIILLKAPLELSDVNQITFSNATAQFNYFYGLPKLEVKGATYQRKDNVIRFPALYDTVISYNYVMYRNDNYSNKWFYAYIEDVAYINDNLTAIIADMKTNSKYQYSIFHYIKLLFLSVGKNIKKLFKSPK